MCDKKQTYKQISLPLVFSSLLVCTVGEDFDNNWGYGRYHFQTLCGGTDLQFKKMF